MKQLLVFAIVLGFSLNAHADNTSKRFLLSALNSRTTSDIQLAAVKSLRQFANDSETLKTLLNVALNSSLDSSLRQEAIKSLANDARNSRTWKQFVRLYQNENDIAVKATILRSLYLAASGNGQVQDYLEDVLRTETDEALQEAAAFGLLASAGNGQVANLLMQVAASQRHTTSVRIQAIKSLYLYRSNRAQDLVGSLAQNESTPSQLRQIAIYTIQATFPASSRKRDFLMNLAARDRDQAVRLVAIDALRPALEEKDVRRLNLPVDPRNGISRNPLEN